MLCKIVEKSGVNCKKKTRITFIVTVIGRLTGIAAAIAMGVLSPSLLIPAIAIGMVAISILACSFSVRKRSLEARNELNKWKDPMPNLIEQCRNLNYLLKAEENMKTKIGETIVKGYKEILNLISKGEIHQLLVNKKLGSLA
jgi:hypothetical protein